MDTAYLSLGANLGNPLLSLEKVLRMFSEEYDFTDVTSSKFYKTSPVGDIPQPDFINSACSLKTTLNPYDFFKTLKEIENSFRLGNKLKKGPRHMDIDVLFFGTQKCNTPHFQLPHPSWNERLFVLIPLRDLISTITLPSGEIVDLDRLIKQVREKNPNDSIAPLQLSHNV